MTSLPAASAALSIGQVVEQTGMSVHALRYYEREMLLIGEVQRTGGGRRLYTGADVDWLMICVKLRASGMPLVDLKKFADLVRHGTGNEHERLQLLNEHKQRVEAQIVALEECRTLIAWKVGVYTEHIEAGTVQGVWDPAIETGGSSRSARTDRS